MTGGRTRLCLTFDGGSRGNPGPAYGSFVVEGLPGLEPRIQRLTFGRATNNEAEYRTLIAGLAFLDQHLRRGDGRRAHNLEIRGDSQLVLSQVEGSWRTRNARMAALRAQAVALLEGYRSVRITRMQRWRIVRTLGH
jgi:ribonuclease HI